MTDEKIIGLAQTACVIAVAAGAVYFQLLHRRQPVPAPTFYFMAKGEAAQATLGLGEFVRPDDLRLERVDDKKTNVWGWYSVTNHSGNSKTQWFKCVVATRASGKPYVESMRNFDENPQASAKPIP